MRFIDIKLQCYVIECLGKKYGHNLSARKRDVLIKPGIHCLNEIMKCAQVWKDS